MQNTELNMVYKWLRIALICLSVLLGVWALVGLKSLGDVEPAFNTITVVGEGKASGVPDIATFSFFVSADSSSVSLAQDAAQSKIGPIIKSLQELGIEEKDIKTENYSVYPKYVYEQLYCIQAPCPSGRQKLDGYTASHSVSIKVRDTSLAGKAVQVAGDKGATNISGISFTFEDPDKLENDARALAIADARSKAKSLAKSLGVRIVRVVSYSEGGSGYGGALYAKEAMSSNLDERPAPSLPTGENEVRTTVDVTYEIR